VTGVQTCALPISRRIQIFGEQEVDYHADLTAEQRHAQIANLISKTPPCVIVADGRTADPELELFCQRSSTPLFTTPVSAAEVIDHLRTYLTKIGAPQVTMHGVFMDILGLGVLIMGESGLGKSELGLELISRGHGLVADDAVDFSRLGPDYIEGRCPVILRDLLEVRGLGLLDIRTIFGETAVRRKLKLRLIVQLVRRNDGEFERLPIDAQFIDVLGTPIRTVKIQVAAGRNLAVLVEAAVRNTILQLRGIDTLKEFIERQRIQMITEAEEPKNQGRLI
jgi:HPr kinase/phosphorylase